MKDLKWLESMVDSLPDKPEYRKNLIDIAGYPSRETVNSNLLAFYFDGNGEHGFEQLFLKSLLSLLDKNEEGLFDFIEGDYEIDKEVATDLGNRIDLVIRHIPDVETENAVTPKWAIIIENKIDSGLDNPLKDYWTSVDAENKIGFVLSKHPIVLDRYNNRKSFIDNGIVFHSITHKDLLDKVQKNLHEYFMEANDKHLLYLKEFISYTDNFYNTDAMDQDNEQVLKAFHENHNNIKEFNRNDKLLLEYVTKVVVEIFNENGFVADSSTLSKWKYFSPKKGGTYRQGLYRFYVNLHNLKYDKIFSAFYEVYHKKDAQYGTKVKSILKEENGFTKYVRPGKGGNDKATYQHIYNLEIPIGDFEEGFKEALRQALDTHFWKNENKFLESAQEAFEKIENEEAS